MPIADIIFYALIFVGIYIQVFFFMTLVIERGHFKKKARVLSDYELPEVTFLIPCWNESATITGTVASLRDLEYPKEKIKMIIIDDGSTDATWDVLQQYANDSDILLIHKENGGKTDSLNVALPHVTTEYMCSIDADTFLAPDALKKITAYMIERPELVAVGGTVMIHNPKTIAQSAQRIDYQMFSFSKKMLGLLGAVMVAPGAFSLYKTSVLQDVGGYQEGHGLEDLELTYRLQEQGYKVDQCHTATAYTTGPASIMGLFRQRLRWSYGFLNNTFDYRRIVFNRKFGTFGLFTIPMGVISYFIVIYMFIISWFFIFRSLIDTIIQVRIQGLNSLWSGIDLFFFGTRPITMLVLMMYGFIVLTILIGRWLSGVKTKDYHRFPLFLMVYGLLVPLWILRSTANFLLAKRPAWR